MRKTTAIFLSFLGMSILFYWGCESGDHAGGLEPGKRKAAMEGLGRQIFFDENLSNPGGVSCGTCHDPSTGFADSKITSTGSLGFSGNRNTPTVKYSKFVPALQLNNEEGIHFGGFFMDGRANDLRKQAEGPMFERHEMNIGSKEELLGKLRVAKYAGLFKSLFGEDIFEDKEKGYEAFLDCLSAYESSSELNPFSSRFDKYIRGEVELTEKEKAGLELFNDPKKGNCASCHPSTADPVQKQILFTDFTYDNLGIPKNPLNPFYRQPASVNPQGVDFLDAGFGSTRRNPAFNGQFRVPTLRNIAVTAPYGHNGYFKTLDEVMEFYNSRDAGYFPAPEYAHGVNTEELVNLKLSKAEMDAIVAFMGTLTDE